MLTIPIQRSASEFDLYVVLEDENLKRIRDYDPCEIATSKLGPIWNAMRLRTVCLYFATADEIKVLTSIQDRTGVLKFIDCLARGFKFRPELGDSDANYQSPGRQ